MSKTPTDPPKPLRDVDLTVWGAPWPKPLPEPEEGHIARDVWERLLEGVAELASADEAEFWRTLLRLQGIAGNCIVIWAPNIPALSRFEADDVVSKVLDHIGFEVKPVPKIASLREELWRPPPPLDPADVRVDEVVEHAPDPAELSGVVQISATDRKIYALDREGRIWWKSRIEGGWFPEPMVKAAKS
ncbi:MAG: hypothetical protein AAFX50_17410 [Acidobacteriota bacterium]